MRCNSCGKKITLPVYKCDWRQGRCPNTKPLIDANIFDFVKEKSYNILTTIKGWFK